MKSDLFLIKILNYVAMLSHSSLKALVSWISFSRISITPNTCSVSEIHHISLIRIFLKMELAISNFKCIFWDTIQNKIQNSILELTW